MIRLRKQFLTLVLLLCLTLLVTAVSAASVVSAGSATFANVGDTGTINITLDSAPDGLAGYNLTVSLGNSNLGSITQVVFPDWASPKAKGQLPSSSVFLKAGDDEKIVAAGSTDIVLATLTVRGDQIGTTPINIQLRQIDAIGGGDMLPTTTTQSGSITVGTYQSPVADFTYSPASGTVPFDVQFNDASTYSAPITTYAWNFGDGTSDTVQNPLHTYSTAGTYDVSLTVTDSLGGTDTKNITGAVVANNPIPGQTGPIAAFTNSPTSGLAPLQVTFTDQSIAYLSPINGWLWDFGDGTNDTVQNPVHTYAAPGFYPVTLTVTDSGGLTSNPTVVPDAVIVHAPGPMADFVYAPSTGLAPLDVVFNDTSTTSGASAITSWSWDFGDGSAVDTVQNPVHTYAIVGNFTVTLTVTDALGATSTKIVPDAVMTTAVPPAGPVADFTWTPTNGTAPLAVTFTDASASAAGIASWDWNFGDGTTDTVQNPVHTYVASGVYDVTLNVTDINGLSNLVTKTGAVTVTTASGIVVDFSANLTTGNAPLDVAFTDLTTSANPISSWSWNFGDGTTDTVQNPTHTYAAAGLYDVTLTVTDNAGSSANTTKTGYINVVSILPPVATFSWTPVSPLISDVVTFDGSASYDPNPTPNALVNYTWTFGPADIQYGPVVTHSFAENKTYDVTLTVESVNNLFGSLTQQVSVWTPVQVIDPGVAGIVFGQNGTIQSVTITGIPAVTSTTGALTTVYMQDPSPAWSNITLVLSNFQNTGGVYTGDVMQAFMTNAPVVTALNATIGSVTTQVGIDLASVPVGQVINQQITEGAPADLLGNGIVVSGGFHDAAAISHLNVDNVAYTIHFQQTTPFNANLTPGGMGAAFNVSISSAWVAANGGRDSIRLIRLSDDGLTMEVLSTQFVATDGVMDFFTAVSPHGLSYVGAAGTHGDPIQSAFTAVPMIGSAPLTVQFTDVSTTTTALATWFWDFGDGQTDTTASPVHVYQNVGSYVVNHTVTNLIGNWSSSFETIMATTVPSGATGSETLTTPVLAPGNTTLLDFSTQTGTTLDITVNNNITAGTMVNVTSFTTPPVPGMATPPATFSLLGEYITIDAPLLEGNVSQVNITMKYNPASIPAGVSESSLTIQYFNRVTNAWEALPGPHGVDTVNHIVWAISSHLSDYGVTYSTPASPPSPSGGGGASGGGGGGGSGGSSGSFGRTAGLVTSGQQAPSAASMVTNVNGIGPLTSGPLTADLSGLPGVTATWSTQINDNPAPNAKITTAIQQVPDASTMNAFTNALHLAGQDIANLAYVMVVQKTGVTSTGPATITMTAPQDWVTQNGGTDAIKIVRMADDGTTEILTAVFDGYDRDSGYLTFKAASPNGMSSFGLVAVKAYTAPAVTPTSGQKAPTQAPATTAAKSSAGFPLMGIAGVIAALAIIGVALLLFTRRNK